MKYNAVIFDLDGTILSTLEDLSDSVNFALRNNSLPERTIDEVRCFVGNGIRLLIERAVPKNCDLSVVDSVFSDFKSHYKTNCTNKTMPYDGIMDMLNSLKSKGIKLGVLSNKADFAVQDLCERYFYNIFDGVLGEVENTPKKPAPDGVYNVMKRMGVVNPKCVYVGDSDVDVLTAKNANLDCIAVSWGFRDVDNLKNAGAEVIVSTPKELFEEIIR